MSNKHFFQFTCLGPFSCNDEIVVAVNFSVDSAILPTGIDSSVIVLARVNSEAELPSLPIFCILAAASSICAMTSK